MPEVDPTMGEPEKPPSRLEQIKYYTSLFLGALAIVCVFGFLFLVPFVLDPAISTIMHQFVTEPVHCNVSQHYKGMRTRTPQSSWPLFAGFVLRAPLWEK